MKIRRYKKENGQLKMYYEDIKDDGYEDTYYYGGWKATQSTPPVGTKSIYLQEFKAWGFTEELPDAELSCFYSVGMKEKVRKVLNTPTP